MPRTSPYKAIFFDLDGTLLDTAPEIHAAASAVLADLQQPPLSYEQARSFIGDGMERFLKRVLTRQWWGEPDEVLFTEARSLMIEHYQRTCTQRITLFPTVAESLRRLAELKIPCACVTNKPHRFTIPILQAAKLYPTYLPVVVSGDTLPTKKPDPAPLLHAAEQLGVNVTDALMVGDSIADANAAAAAGCDFALVTYGYRREGIPIKANIESDTIANIVSPMWETS